MLDREFDLRKRSESIRIICGTDEAGRGPLAGPVAAGACILPEGYVPEGLDDSKKLTEKKREALYAQITENGLAWGIGLNASLLAMRRAIAAMGATPDLVLVDGSVNRGFDIRSEAVIGGDAKSPSIAAASILAKVTRDRIMAELDGKYPEYGFAQHKGYPTPAHKLAVYEFGPCPEHRRSFLSFLERDRARLEAKLAEKKAAEG